MLSHDLIGRILDEYELPVRGIHGPTHWARVLENGLRLVERTGANVEVVRLFAVFHDAKRVNENIDPDHGRRGAEFATTLRGSLFDLPDAEFELLRTACSLHTDGLTNGDITVQTCWDADRLDLGRVGITPEPLYLCTDAAKDPAVIAWADERACRYVVPDFVETDWLTGRPS